MELTAMWVYSPGGKKPAIFVLGGSCVWFHTPRPLGCRRKQANIWIGGSCVWFHMVADGNKTNIIMGWGFMCLVSYYPPSWLPKDISQYVFLIMCYVHVFAWFHTCTLDLLVSYSWPPGFILLTSWFHTLDLLVSYSWPPGFILLTSWFHTLDLLVSYSWPPGFILLTSWFHTLDLLVSSQLLLTYFLFIDLPYY